jgi:hypothetical protein
MEWLENSLQDFDLPPKNRSDEALRRWRDAVSVVKNPRRRFRMVADLATRRQNDLKRRSTQVPYLLLLLVSSSYLPRSVLLAASFPAYQPPSLFVFVFVPSCSHEARQHLSFLSASIHFRFFSAATSFSSPHHLNRSNSHFPY